MEVSKEVCEMLEKLVVKIEALEATQEKGLKMKFQKKKEYEGAMKFLTKGNRLLNIAELKEVEEHLQEIMEDLRQVANH